MGHTLMWYKQAGTRMRGVKVRLSFFLRGDHRALLEQRQQQRLKKSSGNPVWIFQIFSLVF